MAYTSFFTDVINGYLPEPHASLLNGIIFGVKLKTDKTFITELKRVGLTHLVVLSGMNITIMCSIISALTVKFSKRISLLINIFTVVIFIGFVGIQAPIIRAGFMSILTFVAILYGRKTFAMYTLVLSGILSLLIWPKWLSSISFQLSYAATLGLILFAKVKEDKNAKGLSSFIKYCKSELITSLAAQAFTVPIIFIYFKQISFISPVSNLLVSWAITPIMIFGFITAVLGKVHFVLGVIPSFICYILLSYLLLVIHLLSEIPFVFYQFNE